jgi:hypothetical protein
MLTQGVAVINGLRNSETTPGGRKEPDPRFVQAAALLRKIQVSGSVGLQLRRGPGERTSTIIVFRAPDTAPETVADVRELRTLLGLSQEASEFTLMFGDLASSDREIAVRTRALMHVMSTMAQQVEVPTRDIAEGRAIPGASLDEPAPEGSFRIHSAVDEPADSYIAVRYRNRWFWVDDRDLRSKRVFGLVMLLFTLADTESDRALPLLTIPTG